MPDEHLLASRIRVIQNIESIVTVNVSRKFKSTVREETMKNGCGLRSRQHDYIETETETETEIEIETETDTDMETERNNTGTCYRRADYTMKQKQDTDVPS